MGDVFAVLRCAANPVLWSVQGDERTEIGLVQSVGGGLQAGINPRVIGNQADASVADQVSFRVQAFTAEDDAAHGSGTSAEVRWTRRAKYW